jgi:hypothetical protein
MTVEERLTNLEKLVNAFISSQSKKDTYNEYDKAGIRNTDSIQSENISTNANDISDNRTGIEESYEASLTNTEDIADVRTALEEVYEMIDTKEE